METVLIIGGGLGGLFTGALLAHDGRRVTVVERGATIGGGLQCFCRHGATFGTGMHLVGGFGAGGTLARLCAYLGIDQELRLRRCDAVATISLADGTQLTLPADAEERCALLAARFPADAEGLRRYAATLATLADGVPLFRLRHAATGSIFAQHPDFFTPVNELIDRHVASPVLRHVLRSPSILYDGQQGLTPAFIHALVTTLFATDGAMMEGGAQQLADALAQVIIRAGGEVCRGEAVTAIGCADRRVTGVTTTRGHREAASYVAAIHPYALLRLLPDDALPRPYVQRIRQIPLSVSAFKAFYVLRDRQWPYVAHPWVMHSDDWPERALVVTPPADGQGAWARTVEVVVPMPFDAVRRWGDTTSGRRGADYEAWKAAHLEAVTARIEQSWPGFRSAVAYAFAASPLTLRDWLGAEDGAMYGFRKESDDMALSWLSPQTRIGNLWLTGQCLHLHGICGTPLTAIETAAAVASDTTLLDRIATADTKN